MLFPYLFSDVETRAQGEIHTLFKLNCGGIWEVTKVMGTPKKQNIDGLDKELFWESHTLGI